MAMAGPEHARLVTVRTVQVIKKTRIGEYLIVTSVKVKC